MSGATCRLRLEAPTNCFPDTSDTADGSIAMRVSVPARARATTIEAFCASVIPTTARLLPLSTSSTRAPSKYVRFVPSAAAIDISDVSIAVSIVLLNAKVRFSVLRSSDGALAARPSAELSSGISTSTPEYEGVGIPDMSWNAPEVMPSARGEPRLDMAKIWPVTEITATSVSDAGSMAEPSSQSVLLPVTLIEVRDAADALTYSVNDSVSVPSAVFSRGGRAPSRAGSVVSGILTRSPERRKNPPGRNPENRFPDTSPNVAGLVSIPVTLNAAASAACRRVRLTTASSVYLAPSGGGSTAAPPR